MLRIYRIGIWVFYFHLLFLVRLRVLRFFPRHQFVRIAFFVRASCPAEVYVWCTLSSLFLQTHKTAAVAAATAVAIAAQSATEHIYIPFVARILLLNTSIVACTARAKKRVGARFRQNRKMGFFAWRETTTIERELCMKRSTVKRLPCGLWTLWPSHHSRPSASITISRVIHIYYCIANYFRGESPNG